MDRLTKTITLTELIDVIEAAKAKVVPIHTLKRKSNTVAILDFASCMGFAIFDMAETKAKPNSYEVLLAALKQAQKNVYAAINGNKKILSHTWHDLKQVIAEAEK